ncbi:hypothetical protein D3C84_771950 [compost metagenome]
MQLLNTAQGRFDLAQALFQHVLANAHGLARACGQPGNLGLMAHHEVGFLSTQCRQAFAHLRRSRHQLGLLTGAGTGDVRVTNDKDFPRLEATGKGRVEPL